MKSLQGYLLVATPELRDPNFMKSVVLIFRHSDEGATGLILNRPTKVSLKQVWEQVSKSPCNGKQLLHFGGPCQGPLMAIHELIEIQDLEVMSGVYFSTTNLERLVADGTDRARFFVGYAGWGEVQLEKEMSEGSWRTAPATIEHVFEFHDDLWQKITRQIMDSELVSILNVKHVPRDPSLN